ncbi:Disease resistance protein (CC-NBS-LRR class) family [Rhynchospora pubera]|uniref:Disease resistance protein (CC-NBS-LRR class) family n=1 Tax=Rhynchospora pubera TaxID=906938 RepID=A0AAV8GQ46_9POAL|nr:Disease resistance protein (CC-NBS-LRR class) family [Rhynchospora pubera]
MAGLGAYALMSSLLNLLSNLLPEVKNTFFAPSSSSSAQAPDARAVEDDLRRLEQMLMRIKATLYDAEERNIQDQSIRLWLQEIRDLGREAEYILEEYMYEVYRAQVEARNSSKLSFIEEDINMSDVYSVLIPDGMVDRIRGITSRFEEIAKHREALHLPEEVDAPLRKKIRYTPTFTSSSVVEQNIFGREEEKENVINALLLGGDGISVLPIVGKGGIGKTTVAQLVYNDKKMQGCFDLVGWICVSNDFNIIRIGQNMMESFTEEACKLENPSVLVQKIKNIVKGKKIFLVLDDVWNEDPSLWESFCDPLMLATKVTILVTTRNISVARIMQTMNPLNLGYLSDDKCWLLFTHYAFQRIDPSNQLSYERLPTYLKQCLLLCSMFPKGHMYSMKLMSRLWIANGYIVAKGRKQIEEVAADYTKMLYERSFFDEYNIKMDIGYLLPVDTTFRLHDLVHELARLNLKKTWTSVKLIREPVIFKEECHLYLKLEGKLSGLPQRLCSIQTVVLRITWINPFLKLEEREKNNNILNNLLNAEHLRVLDLEYPTDDVPHFSLGKLKHLRYLSLRHGLFVVRISPESIFSCYNLRILILDIINIHMKLEGIGNLINLEFLQLFMYPRDLPESLGLLKKLRVLELHEDKNYHAGYYGNYDRNFYCQKALEILWSYKEL